MERSKSGSAVRSGPGRQMLRRCVVLAAVFGIGVFAVLLARLYQLQIKEHEFYEELAIEQQLRSTPGSASRGAIYDANMNALAVSATVDNVYLSPAEIEPTARTVRSSPGDFRRYSEWTTTRYMKSPEGRGAGM